MVKKGQFWVFISVVKMRQSSVVITVVFKGEF